MKYLKQLVIVFALFLFAVPAFGADFTIVTPYLGTENNTYIDDQYGIEFNDSQPTKGLFIQSINPEKYQWNVFLYQTPEINYSRLWGINFIYDRYFGGDAKNVIGVGANYFEMTLAGEDISTPEGNLDAMNMNLTIFSPYIRVGKYFGFGQKQLRWTLLPWIGGQMDISRGSGLIDFPGPGSAPFNINDNQFSWIAGVNLKVDFSHYLQLELKRSVAYHSDQFFNKSSAMMNLFMSRNIGLSYRYNYNETTMGKDSYTMFGMAIVF